MKIILQGDEQLDGDGGFVDIGQLCLVRFPNPLAPGIDNQIHGSWGTRLALLGRIMLNDHPCLLSCKKQDHLENEDDLNVGGEGGVDRWQLSLAPCTESQAPALLSSPAHFQPALS